MQTCVYITLHATQINCILQNNAPTNTALPGFSRKRALFNIWEHGPHFHVLMWKETLVCTWKLGFHNVFSTLINANAGIKVELLLLSKNWYTHLSNFPSCFFFLVISILIAVWKDETTPLQLTQLLQGVLWWYLSFWLSGCLFPAHLGASWAMESRETIQEIAWITLLFQAVCLVMWGFRYLWHSREALLWGLCGN